MKSSTILLFLFGMSLSACQTNEFIIFSSGRDGNSNIYQMKLDGSKQEAITSSEQEEWGPTILNKNEITFLRQETDQIIRVKRNLRTGEESQLPHPPNCRLDDKNMRYAPTSKRGLYQCNGDIFLTDAQGNNLQNLTKGLAGKSFKACWQMDESRIFFTNQQNGNQNIYAIKPSGEALVKITDETTNEEAPAISPDGQFLLFSSNRDGNQNQEIYLMDLQTQKKTNITQTSKWELIARWSVDGRFVIYGSNQDDDWELYRYEVKTGKRLRLTTSSGFDGDPVMIRR